MYNRLLKLSQKHFSAQALRPKKIEHTQLFINGKFQDSLSGKKLSVINPATKQEICKVSEAQPEDIDLAVSSARNAFDNGIYGKMSNKERSKILYDISNLIERDSEILSSLETLDNGKPISSSRGDIGLAIEYFRYMSALSRNIHGDSIPADGYYDVKVLREPLGVVGAVTPWNFPLLMWAWPTATAIATGNTVVNKVSEETPLTALYMGKLLQEAGLPDGVVNIVPGLGANAGQYLVSHKNINKASFTGSTATGRIIAKCGAENLIPVTLELGGKSPSIIFPDADIKEAAKEHQIALFLNNGQCCVASSRMFVHESVYDEFVEETIKLTQKRTVGDGFDDPDHGPSTTKNQYLKVKRLVNEGIESGATILLGGQVKDSDGYFVNPTIFGDVKDDMSIAKEEIFGPVMQLLKFKSEEEVIKRANNTAYGLAGSVFTSNLDIANRVSRQIKAGTIWVNCYDIFDAQFPFGGFKQSGYGRIKGRDCIDAFTQTKCIITKMNGYDGPRH